MCKVIKLFLVLLTLFSCGGQLPIITDKDVKGGKRYSYKPALNNKETKYFSGKLGVKSNKITNQKLYVFVKNWEETTYLYGGNDKNGVDCSSLMIHLFDYVYDIDLPRTSLEMYKDGRFERVKNNEPLVEGDLVFFKIDPEKEVSHVGIYLKNNKFFSASSVEGCNISNLKKEYWMKYYIGGGRLKK